MDKMPYLRWKNLGIKEKNQQLSQNFDINAIAYDKVTMT
ncbi:hypothetical protein YN1551_1939 [Sulfolobus islandicus Y.N.15.51]|jgi:hypothetical protein|uniref:Uncharacterized protein n=3 Tax=Saccharolobus islandicus TaxID=43080 RepID=F0NEG8_SACI5|nr:hypothetical protein YN1551_1939 [Sulfolobus islandicus Y.N.15.51]ADX82043.1 hypothetical protein SiH_0686 [Sulfolobus islandicus HVE10/4]ADX84730.1 hypothetical protein SiRe_0647 [Sulfolobus islandicus REY15A]